MKFGKFDLSEIREKVDAFEEKFAELRKDKSFKDDADAVLSKWEEICDDISCRKDISKEDQKALADVSFSIGLMKIYLSDGLSLKLKFKAATNGKRLYETLHAFGERQKDPNNQTRKLLEEAFAAELPNMQGRLNNMMKKANGKLIAFEANADGTFDVVELISGKQNRLTALTKDVFTGFGIDPSQQTPPPAKPDTPKP